MQCRYTYKIENNVDDALLTSKGIGTPEALFMFFFINN